MDRQNLVALNHKLALEAAAKNQQPFEVTQQDLDIWNSKSKDGVNLPFADFGLPFIVVAVLKKPYEYMGRYIVEASGYGLSAQDMAYAEAITTKQFLAHLKIGHSYGVISQGRLFVQVAEFVELARGVK